MRVLRVLILSFLLALSGTSNAQSYEWFSLSETVNGWVRAMVEYDGKLIVGGDILTQVGSLPVNSIAAWDGTWSSLETGVQAGGTPGYVFDMAVYHDSLIVVGDFDQAGSVVTNDVAVWDGVTWAPLGIGSNGIIKAVAVYNDEIYVAGAFDTIGGISARGIAKWNGTGWENLGAGLRYNIHHENVAHLYVYQNTLFATGSIDSADNIACENVAFFDGTVWSAIPSSLPPSIPAMIDWNGAILFGSPNVDTGVDLLVEVYAWDGTDYYTFSYQFGSSTINDFEIFNGELYGGGSDLGYDHGNTVRKWDGTNWVPAGTGINDGVRVLCIYDGELYAGGNFSTSEGSAHNRIARYAELNTVSEQNANPIFKLYPNPATDQSTLKLLVETSEDLTLDLLDVQGRVVRSLNYESSETVLIDLTSLEPGVYYIRAMIDGEQYIEKLVKQ